MYPYPTHSTGVQPQHPEDQHPAGQHPGGRNGPLPPLPLKPRWPYWLGGGAALVFAVAMGFLLVDAAGDFTEDFMGYVTGVEESPPPETTVAEEDLQEISEVDEDLRDRD